MVISFSGGCLFDPEQVLANLPFTQDVMAAGLVHSFAGGKGFLCARDVELFVVVIEKLLEKAIHPQI